MQTSCVARCTRKPANANNFTDDAEVINCERRLALAVIRDCEIIVV
jgi:hypothetical protein